MDRTGFKYPLKAYVDGAYRDGGVGYGFIIFDRSTVLAERSEPVPKGIWADSRQVGGELLATMAVLAWCDDRGVREVTVFYDYEGIRAWATGKWRAKKDITQTYVKEIRSRQVKVRWVKVKSHSGDPYNERVDRLAKEGAAGISCYWEEKTQLKEAVDNAVLSKMKEARNLYKEKAYAQALPLFENLWLYNRSLFYPDDMYSFCVCLRKDRRSPDALEVAEALIAAEPNNTRFNNIYGWILYDCLFHDKSRVWGAELLEQAQKILSKTKQEPNSPYELTVIKTLEWLYGLLDLPEGHLIESWIEKVNPEALSVVSYNFEEGRGKTVRKPSNAESWYLAKAKCLLSESRFSDCFLCCNEALALIAERIPDGDTAPFLRLRGVARFHLGSPNEALPDLLAAQKLEKKWPLPLDIAKVYFALGDQENAYKYALKAALFPGSELIKLECYSLLADIYRDRSLWAMERKCLLMYQLVLVSLEIEGDPETTKRAQTIACPPGLSFTQLYNELIPIWRVSLKPLLTPVQGKVVKRSIPKKGFIKGNDGREYIYAPPAFQGPIRGPNAGDIVEAYYDPDEIPERPRPIEAYWVVPSRRKDS